MIPSFEIQLFLNDFKAKLSVWGVVYRDDRPKNTQTLLTLDIFPSQRTEVLKSQQVKDYCQGPRQEKLYKEHQCGFLVRWSKVKRYIYK
ncbi:MAG: hypothetical protein WKG06_07590 [Segetibacter sp.]